MRRVAVVLLTALLATARFTPAAQNAARVVETLPARPDSLKFAVLGDNGTGDTAAVRRGTADGGRPRDVSVRHGRDARRQHVRAAGPAGLRHQVRAPVCGAAPGGRALLRVTGQSRQPGQPLLQAVQHGRRAVLHLREEERAVFRARYQPARSEAAGLVGRGAPALRRPVADLLLPSPHLLRRRSPWIGCFAARRTRTAPGEVPRQRRVLRTRPHLRAVQAAKGHHVLRLRVGWTAAQGRRAAVGADRGLLRPGPVVHARRGSGRRPVLRGCRSIRRESRLRCHPSLPGEPRESR